MSIENNHFFLKNEVSAACFPAPEDGGDFFFGDAFFFCKGNVYTLFIDDLLSQNELIQNNFKQGFWEYCNTFSPSCPNPEQNNNINFNSTRYRYIPKIKSIPQRMLEVFRIFKGGLIWNPNDTKV